MIPKQEHPKGRHYKFGSLFKSSPQFVKSVFQDDCYFFQIVTMEVFNFLTLPKALKIADLQVLSDFLGGRVNFFSLLLKVLVNLLEYPNPVLGWKVGSTIKRLLGRAEKHVEWPSPVTAHGLNGFHVHLIDVRTLFTINLDANKEGVHDLGEVFLFKRVAFHHMAPMASRVTNAD